jgi:glyoxylase-like metal-dependent hydrolase (beta-lactamase superfamily II)
MPDAPEIAPLDLALALESGAPLQVLDIRAPHAVAGGTIAVPPSARFLAMPGSRLFAGGDPAASGLDPGVPVTVVCGHGNSSRQVTAWLAAQGFDARSLNGGMAAWGRAALPRPVPAPAGFDALVQFDRLGKGALGYLLISGGEAVVIDPPRVADLIEQAAERAGAAIVAVMDTHTHADYLTGGPALATRLGVPYHLHAADGVSPFDGRPGRVTFAPYGEGDTVRLGRETLGVIHTPGHTLGSVTLVAGDTAFTGDFVFVRSVGRPDLAGKAGAWVEDLWRSLERVRREWPADLIIRPAHYATDDERAADRSVGGRWGELLAANEALAIRDAAAFREWVRTRTREAPEAYRIIKTVNLGLARVSDAQADELEGGKNECAA